MAHPSFDLSVLLALADSGAYGGIRVLSANSAVLTLCAGVWLSELENWQGAGDALTQDEIDTIEEMVATLEFEAQYDAEADVSDYVLLDQQNFVADVASIVFEDYGDFSFQRYSVELSGLMSDRNGGEDFLVVQLNDDAVAADYVTTSNIVRTGGSDFYHVDDRPGYFVYGACGAEYSGIMGIGVLLMSIFQPQSDNQNRMSYTSGISGQYATRSHLCQGVGWFKNTDKVDKIEIYPYAGTTFLVGGEDEPDNLNVSLYGVR